MGVFARLNALDERAGVRGTNDKAYARIVRLWWVWLAGAYALIVGFALLAVLTDHLELLPSGFAVLPAVFWSGFYYNERLRSLGRRPRLSTVPRGWPNDTT